MLWIFKPKDEAEFCEVSPVMAVLVKQLLLPLLEQLDRLLALLLQVLDEDLEVLIRVQQVQLVLQVMSLKSAISFSTSLYYISLLSGL